MYSKVAYFLNFDIIPQLMPIPLEGAQIAARTIGRTGRDLITINRSTNKLLEAIKDPDERNLLEWYCNTNPKGRKNLLFISNYAQTRGLSDQERFGVMEAMLLIGFADQFVDDPQYGLKNSQENDNSFRQKLLSIPFGETGTNLGTLLNIVRRNFEGHNEKKEALDMYLQTMINLHANHTGFTPGEFSFSDVVSYREKTNTTGIEMGSILLDIKSPRSVDLLIRAIRVIQARDDLSDIVQDFDEKSANLFIGMAKKFPNELNTLRSIIYGARENGKNWKPRKRWMRKHMPNTYREYKNYQRGLRADLISGRARRITGENFNSEQI